MHTQNMHTPAQYIRFQLSTVNRRHHLFVQSRSDRNVITQPSIFSCVLSSSATACNIFLSPTVAHILP